MSSLYNKPNIHKATLLGLTEVNRMLSCHNRRSGWGAHRRHIVIV